MLKRLFSALVSAYRRPLVRLATSLAVLAILMVLLPLSALWDAVQQLSATSWILTVGVFMAAHVGGVVKWRLLIDARRGTLPFTHALRYYFAGLFANLFLPSMTGGDVVRAGLAARASQERSAVVVGSVVDRGLDVCALLVLIVAGGLLAPDALRPGDRVGLLVAAGGLAGAATVAAVLYRSRRASLSPRAATLLTKLRRGIRLVFESPGRVAVAFTLSLAIQTTFVLLSAFIGSAIGIEVGLGAWFFAWPLAKVSAMLPISIGGLGVREAALAVFLGRFGVAGASAVGLGLIWQTVVVAAALPGAAAYFFSRPQAAKLDDVSTSAPAHP